ncbi:MAG: AzlC family ABC transporter permease [Lachnospiraceae bacterium]|nr:AzlC family ABC transporter permease [Lachnospiraceae bacterium]
MKQFVYGVKDGIPIALGYASVAFTFGLVTMEYGLSWWQATLISLTCLTSAGQFAGIGTMAAGGSLLEMAVSQLVINLRYGLMGVSLSQNVTKKVSGISRWILAYGITDEIFAVAISKTYKIGRGYLVGLYVLPVMGWTLGTMGGALLGSVLPQNISSALGVALYGMFIAVVVPPAKENRKILAVVGIAVGLSCIFKWTPMLKTISSGTAVIISAVIAAFVGAVWFPMEEEGGESQ